MTTDPIVIVGGGVSGLATAYYLARADIQSLLIEKSSRLGGLIRTDSWEGCTLEAGPDSYLAAKPAVTELASELGGPGTELVGSNDQQRRVFIVRSGNLVALPKGMSMMVPGRWRPALESELFSLSTKLQFVRECARRPRQRQADISVGELVSEHFGQELLDYVADPLLAGVYGGDAAQLSAASVLPRFMEYEERFGSLIRGVRRAKSAPPASSMFLSFRDGMQSLTDGLASAIAGRTQVLHEEVISVSRNGKAWSVRTGSQTIAADAVVMACPTHTSARLIERAAPELATQLEGIPYSSAILVTLVYDERLTKKPLDGAGLLIPKRERRTVAAATWINAKFPVRVAKGLVAVRAFIVGAEAIQLGRASNSELIDLVVDDLTRFVGFEGAPRFSKVDRWPHSMPQYVVGHRARQQRIAGELAGLERLHLVGNAFDGVGVPDCVRLAKNAAAALTPD